MRRWRDEAARDRMMRRDFAPHQHADELLGQAAMQTGCWTRANLEQIDEGRFDTEAGSLGLNGARSTDPARCSRGVGVRRLAAARLLLQQVPSNGSLNFLAAHVLVTDLVHLDDMGCGTRCQAERQSFLRVARSAVAFNSGPSSVASERSCAAPEGTDQPWLRVQSSRATGSGFIFRSIHQARSLPWSCSSRWCRLQSGTVNSSLTLRPRALGWVKVK